MHRAAVFPAFAAMALLIACTGSEAAAPAADTAPASTNPAIANPASAPEARSGFAVRGELTQGGFIRGTAPAGARRVMLGGQALQLAEDGSFFAAFDRDSAGELALVAALSDGAEVRQSLTIAPRAWNIERVNIARTPGASNCPGGRSASCRASARETGLPNRASLSAGSRRDSHAIAP